MRSLAWLMILDFFRSVPRFSRVTAGDHSLIKQDA